MKKYAGVKPMDEIKKAVIANGWPYRGDIVVIQRKEKHEKPSTHPHR